MKNKYRVIIKNNSTIMQLIYNNKQEAIKSARYHLAFAMPDGVGTAGVELEGTDELIVKYERLCPGDKLTKNIGGKL